MSAPRYLLAGQASELERLQLQSRVWEPSGHRLLEEIGNGQNARAVDIGCGVMGWLRLLSEWVGPDGEVVGTDNDDAMLAAAKQFVADKGLPNVVLRNDDLFATSLEAASFDLVHARFELTPLGRGHEQMETYVRLLRPGGTVALEDPDWGSWHFNPPAPACERLIVLICEAFARWGDAEAGRKYLELLRRVGIEGNSVRFRAGFSWWLAVRPCLSAWPVEPGRSGLAPERAFDHRRLRRGGGITQTQGKGTAVEHGMEVPVVFDADMRSLTGRYVGTDGQVHEGTFGFI